MAAPRTTIDALPEKTTLTGAEWFVVQDGATSKKVSATHVGSGDLSGGTTPDGGFTGQVLGKLSNANQDIGWVNDQVGIVGSGVNAIVALSQTAYDALPTKIPTTLYVINS